MLQKNMQRKVYLEVSINNFISRPALNYEEFFAFFFLKQVVPHTFVLLLQTNINATHYSGLPDFSVEFILYLINLKRIFRRHNNQR